MSDFFRKCEYFDKKVHATDEEMKAIIEEEDRRLWENTKYDGMEFTKECEWENLVDMWKTGYLYASPIFKFENGDRVAISRTGEIVEVD